MARQEQAGERRKHQTEKMEVESREERKDEEKQIKEMGYRRRASYRQEWWGERGRPGVRKDGRLSGDPGVGERR